MINIRLESEGYYVYIVTNLNKTVFKIGTAGVLYVELDYLQRELQNNKMTDNENRCLYLVYWEKHSEMLAVIEREEVLNKLSTRKKVALISKFNPEWRFLNEEIKNKESVK
jgi:putative endonuclease